MQDEVRAPDAAELPTLRQLNRATAAAAGVAAMLLAVVVLPAEYGVDPTGAGRLLGLTQMGEAKRAAANAPEATAAASAADNGDILMDGQNSSTSPPQATAGAAQTGNVRLVLQPGEGTEVKATMRAGDEMQYEWSTEGARVNFELHGEEAGAGSDEFTSYEKGTSAGESGTFRAPFDGTHGWYWRNRTGAPITINVRATGAFSKFEQLAG